MKIKKEDIKRIIEILESKYNELEEGEYFEFNGKELVKSNIPKKWCILIEPSNQKELEEYWNTLDKYRNVSFGGWLLSDEYDGTYLKYANKPKAYEEITIEQFRKFIKNKS